MNQLRFKKAPVFGSLPNCSKKKLHLRSKMAGSSQSMIKALFIIALYILSANVYSQKIKIAYVGNSITIAHHIPWGEPGYEAYSDISAIMLNQYFGNIADIQNFGNGGKTLVDMIDPKTGLVFDGSYMRQSSFTDALKFAPDICFISLGTNDGTTSSWPDVAGSRRYVKEFYGDYLSMIDSFKVKNPNTKIIVCYPPPVFGVNLVYDDAMAIKMRPEIDKVIATSGSDSLDWHTLLKNKAALFSNDRIHPLVSGSALMGKFAFEKLLRSDLLRSKMSGASLALNKPVAVSSFIGSNDGIKAVDLDQASYWEANISGQQWISTDLGLNYDTKILRLVWGESLSKNYSIQVSDNNTDWTTIKTITGDTSRVNVTMNLTGSGRYVRLLLTDLAGASFKLKEFEVFGNLHLAGVDFTKLGGIATAQYSSDSVSGPEKAIDAFADTKFMTANKSSWLEYSAKAFYKLNGYTVTSGSEGSNKDPIKWILQGSKDDNIWVPLDSVGYDKIVAFKTRYEKQNFQVSDTARYAFFRLLLTSATTSVHIGGLELFGDYKSVAVPSYMLSFTATPVSFVDRLLGARSYKESETVQIIAGKSSGFYFHGWTGSDQDVALLANPLADTTTFSMPNRAVSFKANFSRTPNVDIQSAQSSLIKLFPNPVKNELNISGLSKSDFVNIFNSAGVKMKIKTGSVINVAGLPKGKYLVSINTPQGVVRKSFLKE